MMDPHTIAGLSILMMVTLMALGVPVAISMLAVAAGGMFWVAGSGFMLSTLSTLPYAVASSYSFAALPMFVTMGIFAGSIGIIRDLYRSANMWFARLPGSLYMATVCASGAFGAVNGSTVVSAALFTRIALPEMHRLGYSLRASAGCIAAAGTFAAMIPPSISMVIYGLLTDVSIGRILIAGLLPGLLTISVYLAGIALMVRIRPGWAPPAIDRYSTTEKLRSLRSVWPVATVAFLVIGGIYSGLVSPSAAGAVGAIGVLLIGLFTRRLDSSMLKRDIREAATISATLYFIVIGGLAFSRLLLVTGAIDDILGWYNTAGLQPWMIMVGVIALYLLLGALMDPISMMVITVPIIHPLVVALGYDPVWFAIIVVKMIELSVITPPVGLNLFVVVSASRGLVKTDDLYRGIGFFVVLELITLLMIVMFPQIALFLPNLMIR